MCISSPPLLAVDCPAADGDPTNTHCCQTQKAARLLRLLRDIKGAEGKGGSKGIIFVKQIALLHPLVDLSRKEGYQVAPVGGTSSMSERDRNKVGARTAGQALAQEDVY